MIKTIANLERLHNSKNGNPRYRVTFTDGTVFETAADASINYGITNREYRDVPLEVTFSRNGRITYLAPVSGGGSDDDLPGRACGGTHV